MTLATGGKRVFDAAFYRWGAIHNSQEILVRQTVRNFGVYAITFIIPVILGTKLINRDMVSLQKLFYTQCSRIDLTHLLRLKQYTLPKNVRA